MAATLPETTMKMDVVPSGHIASKLNPTSPCWVPESMLRQSHQDTCLSNNASLESIDATSQNKSPGYDEPRGRYPPSIFSSPDDVYKTSVTGSETSPSQSSVSINSEVPTQLSELFTPTIQKGHTGIPASNSWQSIPTMSTLASPDVTPQKDGMDRSMPPRLLQLTEPRNYAPRTSGLVAARDPPPKFDLMRLSPKAPRDQASDDAFVDSLTSLGLQRHSELVEKTTNNAIVPFQHGQVEHRYQTTAEYANGPQQALPTLRTALSEEHFPFTDAARLSRPKNNGVIRLKNIPFGISRAEIIALLGRSSRICNEAEEPVHVIMERVSSKTMDAYVEFLTLDDAMKAVERHHEVLASGKTHRLGNRPVQIELSSQAVLMADLFPNARGIRWDGARPEIQQCALNEPWNMFKGFVTEEEMIMLVKHVEMPQRSPFSKDCPQRPYECLISTIKKFPWYMSAHITIKQRGAMFRATCDLMNLLLKSIQKSPQSTQVNRQLLDRLAAAAMECPGFTPLMKDDIAWIMNMEGEKLRRYNLPQNPFSWRHIYALTPKCGSSLDVIEWYIAVIREQTHRDHLARPLEQRCVIDERSQDTDMYWGYLWVELGYHVGPSFDELTLAQVALNERGAIERILARALPAAN